MRIVPPSEELLVELYRNIPKLGPGSPETTRSVYSMLQLPKNPTILDVGCATGMSSIELARLSGGRVIAFDINEVYLSILKQRAEEKGVAERIQTSRGSIHNMNFDEKTFDVIWAENIVFVLGLERALNEWKRFLKSRGYFVISILVRCSNNVPEDASAYWEAVYPNVKTHETVLRIIEQQDYRFVNSLSIPESDTMKNCYLPLEKEVSRLREKYSSNGEFMDWLNLNQREIDMVRKYGSEYYVFTFYIMQKQ
jgi:ubiquinone/menaquinone biosynthesis C-methylase UbiE